ncbi:hypothetical protein AYI69_g4015 [Smittium culicis]|uniref:Uncharacterized protein n=1 Tax=Smittium culicis TaxID=133412 RepID=A0A1R1YHD6_9FUNG|nr:hypothetical protein AYI69_g4015 [Smittium culicis]
MRTIIGDLASTITLYRIDNMHKIMDLPGREPQLVESRAELNGRVPFFSTNSKGTVTPLQRRQSSKFPQPKTNPTPPTIKEDSSRERGAKIFLIRARIRALSIANYVLPRGRTFRYVSGRLGETHRRSMGEEHSRERVCDSVQESNPEQESPEKEKFTQVFSEGECRGAADASTFDAPPPSLQEEDGPGGERGHHKGGNSSLVEESYRGGEGENPWVLQQPLHDPKKDRRPPPSIGSPGAQQPYGGALLQDADPYIQIEPDTIPTNITFGDGIQFQIDEPKGPQEQNQRSPHESQQTREDGQYDVEMSGELHWEICVGLFRQHHVDFLCQEVWKNHLKSIFEDFRRHLVTLSEIEYPTANDVCPKIPQSCRYVKQTDCSNGVTCLHRNRTTKLQDTTAGTHIQTLRGSMHYHNDGHSETILIVVHRGI